jgi:hypothetical protein
MKLNSIFVCATAIAMGLVSVTAFATDNYYPPERLHCKADASGKLTCSDFNRKYLVEDTHTADFPAGKEVVLTFASGAAYTDHNQWSVFYTFKDTHSKNMKLKSTSDSIQADLKNGAWKQLKDLYTCTAGYMSCPITNLPA